MLHLLLAIVLPHGGHVPDKAGATPAMIVTFVESPASQISLPKGLGSPQDKKKHVPNGRTNVGNKTSTIGSRSPTKPVVNERTSPPDQQEIPLTNWRESIHDLVRPSRSANDVNSAERAVISQSTTSDGKEETRLGTGSDSVAKAFEAALGKGWASGAATSEIRPDGSRVERVQTPNGTYCVRIPGQATSIDPFIRQERPLIAVKC
ncbi:hypothetical protein [Pandoraea capi]|uniref:hypothetical protein n=1 Tax=Pandoraea capi TaxID=2508286 RepID=UPI00124242D6|nr:hypothetical protein [Pandoraea capi]